MVTHTHHLGQKRGGEGGFIIGVRGGVKKRGIH